MGGEKYTDFVWAAKANVQMCECANDVRLLWGEKPHKSVRDAAQASSGELAPIVRP